MADFADNQVRQVALFSANTTSYTYNAYGDLTSQSVPLINALDELELPTFVFFNQSGTEPPGNVPVTAPSLDLLRDILAEGLAAVAAAAAARGLGGGGVGGPEPAPCPPVTPVFA